MVLASLSARLRWALLAFSIVSAAPIPAPAQGPDGKVAPPVVIVVDINRIQRDSQAGRAVAQQRDRFQQGFHTEFETSRKQLQQEEMELSKQRAVLGAQAFEERARAFNEQVAAFQRRYQAAIRALEKSTATALNDVQKVIIEATSELAAEMGASLVMHKQNVFLHDERMDVTDRVIERVNKRLPTVNFPAPVVEGEAPAAAKPTVKPAKK